MKKFNVTAVIWKEEAGYVSKCPELGVASAGDNPEDALTKLKEALELYLDNAEELGMMEELKEALATTQKFTSTVEVVTK